MKSKLKILFCNSDYGSCEQNYYFLKNNKEIDIKNSIFLSSPICKKMFSNLNFLNKFYWDKDKKKIEKKIENLFIDKKIDITIVGLTYKKNSLENKIVKLSKKYKIKTGAIQDFWGNIGYFTKDNNPDIFWVIDKFAKKISVKRLKSSEIKIIGSPKYEKKKIKLKFNKYSADNNIVIIGQPFDLIGIKKFYKELSQISYKQRLKFLFLSHPEDKIKSIEFIKKKINILSK